MRATCLQDNAPFREYGAWIKCAGFFQLLSLSFVWVVLLPAFEANAQVSIAVTLEQPSALPQVGVKLSPDLLATQMSGAKFLGVTDAGQAILEFPPGITLPAIKQKLAESPAVKEVKEAANIKWHAIEKLIVLYADPRLTNEVTIADLQVVDRYSKGRFVVVYSKHGFAAATLKNLAENRMIRYVEPNYTYRLDSNHLPNEFGNPPPCLWGLCNIQATNAWETIKASPVLVAVLDSGVDYTHEDLRINMWKNTGETGLNREANGQDDDGNGYKDDVYGYDFFDGDGEPKPVPIPNYPDDTSYHGTEMAGIIGAVGNNGIGTVGVCWTGQLMAVRICQGIDNYANLDTIAKAIDYAVDNRARVINCSWGGPNFSVALHNAITKAQNSSVLIVASAGNVPSRDNDISPHYPGSYTQNNIIAVASISGSEQRSQFSSFGHVSVDIAAPGEDIRTTIPQNTYQCELGGTSLATAFVSGAAALAWAHPGHSASSVDQLKAALLNHSRHLADLQNKCVTGGTLDLSFLGPTRPATDASAPPPVSGGAVDPTVASDQQVELTGMLRYRTFGPRTVEASIGVFSLETSTGTFGLDFRSDWRLKRRGKFFRDSLVVVSGMLTTRNYSELTALMRNAWTRNARIQVVAVSDLRRANGP